MDDGERDDGLFVGNHLAYIMVFIYDWFEMSYYIDYMIDWGGYNWTVNTMWHPIFAGYWSLLKKALDHNSAQEFGKGEYAQHRPNLIKVSWGWARAYTLSILVTNI